jgi:hypothetical protein
MPVIDRSGRGMAGDRCVAFARGRCGIPHSNIIFNPIALLSSLRPSRSRSQMSRLSAVNNRSRFRVCSARPLQYGLVVTSVPKVPIWKPRYFNAL